MGELCFAAHSRHVRAEMQALGDDMAARITDSPALTELLRPLKQPRNEYQSQLAHLRRSVVYKKHGPVHPCPLAAQMTRVIALTALAALGLSGASFHGPFQLEASHVPSSATVRDIAESAVSTAAIRPAVIGL